MNKLYIVSSVSASGKTTLVDHVVNKFNLYGLKTCTTRPIRKNETGREYYFLTKDDFISKIKQNLFVESANVYGEYYGLLKEEIDNNKDKKCIVILDVQGAKTVKKIYPNAVTIFIQPPDKEKLIKRLKKRNTSSEDFNRRLKEMEYELSNMKNYDKIVYYGELNWMKIQMEKLIST